MKTTVEFSPVHLRVNCFDGSVVVAYEVKLETEVIQKMAIGQGETTLTSPAILEAVQALQSVLIVEMHKSVGLEVEDSWLANPEPTEDEDPL